MLVVWRDLYFKIVLFKRKKKERLCFKFGFYIKFNIVFVNIYNFYIGKLYSLFF